MQVVVLISRYRVLKAFNILCELVVLNLVLNRAHLSDVYVFRGGVFPPSHLCHLICPHIAVYGLITLKLPP